MARVPTWWVDLGADTAKQLEELFVEVMANLPMSQDQVASIAGKDQSTVARWAKGKTTPAPDIMLKAVRGVREHLERHLQRASAAEEALQDLVDMQDAGGSMEAKGEVSARIRKLLEDLE